MFIHPIYYHNWRNISTIYIYRITRLPPKEIFSPSNKIHREVGRANDLSTPRYNVHKRLPLDNTNSQVKPVHITSYPKPIYLEEYPNRSTCCCRVSVEYVNFKLRKQLIDFNETWRNVNATGGHPQR